MWTWECQNNTHWGYNVEVFVRLRIEGASTAVPNREPFISNQRRSQDSAQYEIVPVSTSGRRGYIASSLTLAAELIRMSSNHDIVSPTNRHSGKILGSSWCGGVLWTIAGSGF
jgi:hypothetical protein